MLPKIYEMDSVDECNKEVNKYCEISIKLNPINTEQPSLAWDVIMATKNSILHYDHGLLYHKRCVNNTDDLQNSYDKEFAKLGLKSTFTEVICPDPVEFSTGIYEVFVALMFISYVIFVIYATAIDIYFKRKLNKNENKLLSAFSLTKNTQKLLDVNNYAGKTKSIQGLRVITMVIIIIGHSVGNYFNHNLSNPEFVEHVFMNPFQLMYNVHLLTYMVQIFFVISSFLLSVHLHEIYDRHKKFTLKYVLLMTLNRYLRLIPVIAVIVALVSCQTFINYLVKAPMQSLLYKNMVSCRSRWLYTIGLIHNNIPGTLACHGGTWYVAVDTHLYILTLLLVYIKIKFKIKLVKILGITAITVLLHQSYITYSSGIDFVQRPTPQHRMFESTMKSDSYLTFYFPTMANMATYLVGVYFGHIYYVNKNNTLVKTRFINSFWWTITIIIPMVVFEISSRQLSNLAGLIIGPYLKPLFAVSIGMFILGAIFDDEGLPKKILENRLFQIVSSISYSTYVVHFILVFSKASSNLIHLSYYKLIVSITEELAISLVAGLLTYLFIELPMQNIQKMYVPRVSNSRKEHSTNADKVK